MKGIVGRFVYLFIYLSILCHVVMLELTLCPALLQTKVILRMFQEAHTVTHLCAETFVMDKAKSVIFYVISVLCVKLAQVCV